MTTFKAAILALALTAAFAAPASAQAPTLLDDETAMVAGWVEAFVSGEWVDAGDFFLSKDGPVDTRLADLFTLLVADRDADGSRQSVSGTIAGSAFSGVVVDHVYDRATDHGTYFISATTDAGEEDLPTLIQIQTILDRERAVYKISIDGSVAGQSFGGFTQSFTNPFYGGV